MFGGLLEGGFGFVQGGKCGVILSVQLLAELGGFLGGAFCDGSGLIGRFLQTIAEVVGSAVEMLRTFLLLGSVEGVTEVVGGFREFFADLFDGAGLAAVGVDVHQSLQIFVERLSGGHGGSLLLLPARALVGVSIGG